MNEIKQWSILISVVSIFGGILISLLPEGNHKRYFKAVISVVLLYTVIQPFAGMNSIGFNVNDFLADNYQLSENMEKYAQSSMLNSAEKAIENIYYDKSEEADIDIKVKCECKLFDDKIIVDKIIIKGIKDEYEKNLIMEWSESFGFKESTVVFEGEEDG